MLGTWKPNCPAFSHVPRLKIAVHSAQVRIVCASTEDSKEIGKRFYNRVWEKAALDGLLQRPPNAVSIIVGPRSCGKTALLRSYLGDREGSFMFNYVDCRTSPTSSPEAFCRKIQKEAVVPIFRAFDLSKVGSAFIEAVAGSFQEQFDLDGAMKTTVKGSGMVDFIQKLTQKKFTLADVLKSYEILLEAPVRFKQNQKEPFAGKFESPVIIVDEANVLMGWQKDHDSDLRTLLNFFIDITKSSHKCHVVLVTSEYSFLTWIQTYVPTPFCSIYVIGDLVEEEARSFITAVLQETGRPALSDEEWRQVYKVCGGNPGSLRRVVQYMRDSNQGLTKGLDQICLETWLGMLRAVTQVSGAGYTSLQYGKAVRAIASSPRKLVPMTVMTGLLGDRSILEALVLDNQLAVRPYSGWAQDIPREDFLYGEPVVTAPSTTHFCQMIEKLDHILKITGVET